MSGEEDRPHDRVNLCSEQVAYVLYGVISRMRSRANTGAKSFWGVQEVLSMKWRFVVDEVQMCDLVAGIWTSKI